MELLPRLQREEIDAALERHDPPVQQVTRRCVLTAEVVNHKNATVCQRLKRCPVEAARGRVPQLQRVQRELAPDGDSRTPATNPSVVHIWIAFEADFIRLWSDSLVNHRVKHADYVAVNRQRMGNCDIADENVSNGFGNDCLSIARRPVDEQRVPRSNGRTELIQHALIEYQMGKGMADGLAGDLDWMFTHESTHVLQILRMRHRNATHILTVLEKKHGARPASLGQTIPIRRCADGSTAR